MHDQRTDKGARPPAPDPKGVIEAVHARCPHLSQDTVITVIDAFMLVHAASSPKRPTKGGS